MNDGRRPTSAACQEAETALLLGQASDDATTRVRIDRHVGHCADCQAVQRSLLQTRTDVRGAARPLDDVHRARILARLAPAIDEQASRLAARPHGRRAPEGAPAARWRRWLLPAGALAVAGAAAVLLAGGLTQRWRGGVRADARGADATNVVRRATTVAGGALAPAPTAVAPPTPAAAPTPPATEKPALAAAPALIVPYRVIAGRGAARDARLVDQHFQRLRTTTGTTVRARVGERTRVSLVGATDVSVLSAVDDVLDVGLDAGTLVADFAHRHSGRLRIHSPGAVTEVVGTLFSVEVRGQQSRVSVAHGRVVVQPPDGPPRVLSGGQSWTSGTPSVEAVPAATAALLAQHDAANGAPPAAAPISGPEAAIAPAPAPVPAAAPTAASSAAPSPVGALAPVAPAAPTAVAKPAAVVALVQRPAGGAASPPAAATAAAPTAPALAPPTTPATPETLYRDAESAMRRRDWPAAQRTLERVVADGARGALEDVARYELAQLAVRAGDDARAARWLDTVLASDSEPALREPARFLRCELRARAGDSDSARRCWEGFRAAFPDSSRDALALGWLLRLAPGSPACPSGGNLAGEYLRRYPTGADAALARQRKAACGP